MSNRARVLCFYYVLTGLPLTPGEVEHQHFIPFGSIKNRPNEEIALSVTKKISSYLTRIEGWRETSSVQKFLYSLQ